MKLTKLIAMCILVSTLTSCTITCYQVFSTKPTNRDVAINEKEMLYSDGACVIKYDFWCNGGNPGFLVYNNTNEKLYINLKESFFTLNGIAYDYYEEGSSFTAYGHAQTKASTKVVSNIENRPLAFFNVGQIYSSIESNSYSRMHAVGRQTANVDIVCIPPHSAKPIAKFAIALGLIPQSKKEVKYSEADTPIKFANYISYYTASNKDKDILIKNEFYVDKTNILYEIKRKKMPNNFFITYTIKHNEDPYAYQYR